MGIISNAIKVLKKKGLLQLYHSSVIPYLTYCLEIWGNASDIHLLPLITTQNICRLITFSSYCSHTNILFNNLIVLPFVRRSRYVSVKNISAHYYNTRNKDRLCPAIAKHAYRDGYFLLVGVHVWNYIILCHILKLTHHSLHLKYTNEIYYI